MAIIRVNPPLHVDELTIREYTAADIPALHDAIVRNREYLLPWISDWIKAEPISIEERTHIVQEWIDTYDSKDNPLGIFIGDKLVGSTGLHDRNEPTDVEIGYWVDQAQQGKGIATRVAKALSDWALTQPGVDRVLLIHKVGNDKSYRVAELAGFTQEDTFQECGGDPAIRWVRNK